MTDKKRTTQTSTDVVTRRVTSDAKLTAEEERVVRMIHGLGEGDDHELEFQTSPDDEVNARLRLLEATLLAEMHGQGPLASSAKTSRQAILDHLRKIEDD